MDSDTFITQEKARELVALLERARTLLHDSGLANEDGPVCCSQEWADASMTLLQDIKKQLDRNYSLKGRARDGRR